VATGPLRPVHASRPSGPSRRPRSRPDLLHPGPPHRPPYRHRYGGLFPLRTGNDTPCPRSSPRSPRRSSRHGDTGPAHARSSAPATTTTPSRNQATRAPATHTRPPSTSTASHPEQLDQLRLRGIVAPRARKGVIGVGDDSLDAVLHGRWGICGPPASPCGGRRQITSSGIS
jgi:hypothetical protein